MSWYWAFQGPRIEMGKRQTRKQASGNVVNYDLKLLFSVLFLVGFGIVMVYSASSALALKKFGSDSYFLKKQALFSLIGMLGLVVFSHFPFRWYRPLTYPILISAAVLLVLVQVSGFGFTAGGARRWLQLGSVSFQPAEYAKMALIIYLAYSLSKKQELIRQFSVGLVPHFIILGIFTGLLLIQPDFGSAVILGTIVMVMLFVAGVPFWHLLLSLVIMAPVAWWFVVMADYRLKRFTSFLNPWDYPADGGYQIIHSQMAFGTGGLWGTGIGKGYQKLF